MNRPARALGLSHAPYLAEVDGDVAFSVAVSPSRVRFTVQTLGLRMGTATARRRSSKRGQVQEFSSRSRRRLGEVARDLGELYTPDWMVTLTLPGEWESVCPDGQAFKRHVRVWRRRLERWLRAQGVAEWSGLWFCEFQARGAPHLHVLLWGSSLGKLDGDGFAEWSSASWTDVVGHPVEAEREKHRRAGTRVERVRCGHFGYAVKYASKMEQKRVPDGFRNVGRFWGVWRGASPKPVTWSARMSYEESAQMVRALAGTLPPEAERFAVRVQERFNLVSRVGDTFTATVYGRGAVELVLASVWRQAERPPTRAAERSGSGPGVRRRSSVRSVSGSP